MIKHSYYIKDLRGLVVEKIEYGQNARYAKEKITFKKPNVLLKFQITKFIFKDILNENTN